MAKETKCSSASFCGGKIGSNSGRIARYTVLSLAQPSPKLATVTPSCVAASIRSGFASRPTTILARRSPALAQGPHLPDSRTETNATSAAAKKLLATSRPTTARSRRVSGISSMAICRSPSRRPIPSYHGAFPVAASCQPELVPLRRAGVFGSGLVLSCKTPRYSENPFVAGLYDRTVWPEVVCSQRLPSRDRQGMPMGLRQA